MKSWLLGIATFFIAANFISTNVSAVTIELPEEELAKESVLPVFEGGTVAVKSRRVVTKQRFEVGPMAGMIFNEPFFSQYAGGLHLGYHFNEFHSLAIKAIMRDAKVSSDAHQVDSDLVSNGVGKINFDVVPVPKYYVSLDYQMSAYYGKISLTKETVMNLALYLTGGAGMIDLGGRTTWIANLGVGQNLFFTPRMGLRLDVKFLLYNGLDVTSQHTVTGPATGPVDPGIFSTQFNISPSVMLGWVFLL